MHENVKIHNPLSTQFIRKKGDLSADNIKYFMENDPEFACFYLRWKTHKRFENVSG